MYEERKIKKFLMKNPKATAKEIKEKFNFHYCLDTIRRFLKRIGFKSRVLLS